MKPTDGVLAWISWGLLFASRCFISFVISFPMFPFHFLVHFLWLAWNCVRLDFSRLLLFSIKSKHDVFFFQFNDDIACGYTLQPHQWWTRNWFSIWIRKFQIRSMPMLIRRYFQFSSGVKCSSVVDDDDAAVDDVDEIYFLLRGWMDSSCVYTFESQIFRRKHDFLWIFSTLLSSSLLLHELEWNSIQFNSIWRNAYRWLFLFVSYETINRVANYKTECFFFLQRMRCARLSNQNTIAAFWWHSAYYTFYFVQYNHSAKHTYGNHFCLFRFFFASQK